MALPCVLPILWPPLVVLLLLWPVIRGLAWNVVRSAGQHHTGFAHRGVLFFSGTSHTALFWRKTFASGLGFWGFSLLEGGGGAKDTPRATGPVSASCEVKGGSTGSGRIRPQAPLRLVQHRRVATCSTIDHVRDPPNPPVHQSTTAMLKSLLATSGEILAGTLAPGHHNRSGSGEGFSAHDARAEGDEFCKWVNDHCRDGDSVRAAAGC